MRLVFAGTPRVAVPSLDALVDAGHEVVAVLTRPDAPVGRSRRPVPSPVAVRAAELGIDILRPARLTPEFTAELADLAPDACPVVAYGALVPQSALDVPRHGWVNVHFSLLPAWRGAAPLQRALMAGETTLGITTFELVRELDAGPIYRQQAVEAQPDEVAGEALERLSHLGADLLLDTLADIAAGVTPTPQPTDGITLAPKIAPEDARIDWSAAASQVRDLVRGTSPEPGAWTSFRGEHFKVLRAGLAAEEVDLAPGELLATKRALLVGTGDGVLRLDEVQAFGKKPMRGADWARGANLTAGDRLG